MVNVADSIHTTELTLFRPKEFSIKLHTLKSGWSIVYIEIGIYLGVTGYKLPPKMLFSLRIDFFIANSAYPDEMPHIVAFHLGLHCLQKYPFRGFQSTKGYYYVCI